MDWVIVNLESKNEIWYFDCKMNKRDWKKYYKYANFFLSLVK